jgi:K+-sensing histidine kinase KdpD
VISNLVANGLQYGCEDGPVTVAAKAHGEEIVLSVHNEGPPISENAIRKIVEPMVRQPAQSGDKHTSGLGLGLYIAQEVVTAHGGDHRRDLAREGGDDVHGASASSPPEKRASVYPVAEKVTT